MNKIEIGIIFAVIGAIASGALYLGKLDGRVQAIEKDKDYTSFRTEKTKAIEAINKKVEEAKEEFSGYDNKFSGYDNKFSGNDKKFSDYDKKFSDYDNNTSQFMDFINKEREPAGNPIDVQGGAGWGAWKEETFCPDDHYVCGLAQKIEDHQGDGDDTAMNAVRMWCCEL